jgi:hypothetical protein
MRPAGEPRLDLGCLVGGIVVHDDMDVEPFRDLSIDLFEEVQELGRSVAPLAFGDNEARGDIEGGEQRGRAVPPIFAVTHGLGG